MKKLENFGVEELSPTELEETNGGFLGFVVGFFLGVFIAGAITGKL